MNFITQGIFSCVSRWKRELCFLEILAYGSMSTGCGPFSGISACSVFFFFFMLDMYMQITTLLWSSTLDIFSWKKNLIAMNKILKMDVDGMNMLRVGEVKTMVYFFSPTSH